MTKLLKSLIAIFALLLLTGVVNAGLTACTVINTSANYLLDSNITTTGLGTGGGANAQRCLEINVSNVVLDCQGYSIYTINSTPEYQMGISTNASNVTIKNCLISNFNSTSNNSRLSYSIYASNTTSAFLSNLTLQNITITNAGVGISIGNSADVNVTNVSIAVAAGAAVDSVGVLFVNSRNSTFTNVSFTSTSNCAAVTSHGFLIYPGSLNISVSNSVFSTSTNGANCFGIRNVANSNLTATNVTLNSYYAFYQDGGTSANAYLVNSLVATGNLTAASGNLTVINSTFSLANVSKPAGPNHIFISKSLNLSVVNYRNQSVVGASLSAWNISTYVSGGTSDSNGLILLNYTTLIYNSTNTPFNLSNISTMSIDKGGIANTSAYVVITSPNSSGYQNFVLQLRGADEINTCNRNLTSSGVYYLTNNLTKDATIQVQCINIRANDVVVDCLGYWIHPNVTTPTNFRGIFTNYSNITIQNCNFDNFNVTLSMPIQAHHASYNLSNVTIYNTTVLSSIFGVSVLDVNYSNVSKLFFYSRLPDVLGALYSTMYNSTVSGLTCSAYDYPGTGVGWSACMDVSGMNVSYSHINVTVNQSNGAYGAKFTTEVNSTITNYTSSIPGSNTQAYGILLTSNSVLAIYNSSIASNGAAVEVQGASNISIWDSTLNGTIKALLLGSVNQVSNISNVTIARGNLSYESSTLYVFNSTVSIANVTSTTELGSLFFIVPIRATVSTGAAAISGATVGASNYSIQSATSDSSGYVDFNVTTLVYNSSILDLATPFNFTTIALTATKASYNTTTTSIIVTPNTSQTNAITLILAATASSGGSGGSGGGGGGGGGSGGAASSGADNNALDLTFDNGVHFTGSYTFNKSSFTVEYTAVKAEKGSIQIELPLNYSKYKGNLTISPMAKVTEGSIILTWSDVKLAAGEKFTATFSIAKLLVFDFQDLKTKTGKPVLNLVAIAALVTQTPTKQETNTPVENNNGEKETVKEKPVETPMDLSWLNDLIIPIVGLLVLIVIVFLVLKFGGKKGTTISTQSVKTDAGGIDIPLRSGSGPQTPQEVESVNELPIEKEQIIIEESALFPKKPLQ